MKYVHNAIIYSLLSSRAKSDPTDPSDDCLELITGYSPKFMQVTHGVWAARDWDKITEPLEKGPIQSQE